MKQKIKVVIVNILTCLFLVFILETLIYAGLEKPSLIPGSAAWFFKDYYRERDRAIIQVTDCAKYDSQLFYLLKPGQCVFTNREFNTHYDINSAGLRDDENSLNYPRIVTLGDSYTMGWGVQQDETFPQLLERELGWRVLNAGVSSYGTAREFILLKRIRLDSTQVIIVQYHSNDFEENQEFLKRGNSLPIRNKSSYDSLRAAIDERRGYFPLKHLLGASRAIGKKMIGRAHQPLTQTSEAQAFLDVVSRANVDPAIKILTFKVDEYKGINNRFASQVDSLLRTPAYQALNLETVKLEGSISETDYFTLDEHMNRHGHAKIAAKIRSRILSVLP